MEFALLWSGRRRLVPEPPLLCEVHKGAFFRGASLDPVPPVASRTKDVRNLHIGEGDRLDEAQFTAWVKQASRLPGKRM